VTSFRDRSICPDHSLPATHCHSPRKWPGPVVTKVYGWLT